MTAPDQALGFDFEAAVTAPFRMQPGLRRLAPGAPHLTPLAGGSRHMREKLAVLSAFADDALVAAPGFDPGPVGRAIAAHAAAEHPGHLTWDGAVAAAPTLGCAVRADDGAVIELAPGAFGLGDELARCLRGLPPAQRLAGLLGLAFAEDLALLEGAGGTVPWLAVALPSHWAPREKAGRPFAAVHAPVADNALLLQAAEALVRTVTAGERWERFVWSVTPHPRLHAHPARVPAQGWGGGFDPAQAWFRSERQTFLPLPAAGARCALFTIGVQVRPLAEVAADAARAQALHDALATMSDAVLGYRGLAPVRTPLLGWLQARATGRAAAAGTLPGAGADVPAPAASAARPGAPGGPALA